MKKEVYKVKPIVIYPDCIIKNGIQDDCHACSTKSSCISPRSMCIRPYKNHKNGCPNFGRLLACPPNIPCMYDEIFDVSDVYAVVTKFDLNSYFAKRIEKRPDLPLGQIKNLRVWQSIAIKENDLALHDFYLENKNLCNYVSTRMLECMGVDVVNTMKKVGVNLKFPVDDYAFRVSFVAKVYPDALEKYGFEIYEESSKSKIGVKKLILRNKV